MNFDLFHPGMRPSLHHIPITIFQYQKQWLYSHEVVIGNKYLGQPSRPFSPINLGNPPRVKFAPTTQLWLVPWKQQEIKFPSIIDGCGSVAGRGRDPTERDATKIRNSHHHMRLHRLWADDLWASAGRLGPPVGGDYRQVKPSVI